MSEDRKKILIAEDESDLREALFTTLAAEGYEVLIAKDGEEALNTALAEKPDLVMLDIVMPKRTGHQVLDALQQDEWGKQAKVMMLTALDDMEAVSEAVEKGGVFYLVKSDWKLEDIVKKVNEFLA